MNSRLSGRHVGVLIRSVKSKCFATIARISKDNPLCSVEDSTEAVAKIRNIGIIAHIDAGKTTTTERMLYYSGLSEAMGEVHDGATVTDYMEQERERGITITSASVTFPWRKHKVNLLDTPGHVDFTVEVERCLSVLDGAIVLLDSVSGVEAQTTTVWDQAERYSIPKIVYLNKMDKQAASIEKCLESLKKLDCIPALIQLPLFDEKKFSGVIDVIDLKTWRWNMDPFKEGLDYSVKDLMNKGHYEQALVQREELVSLLAEIDDKMEELVVRSDSISSIDGIDVVNSLRRMVIKNRIVPVFLGSSYKNVGVQPLMDGIVKYFPSPLERINPLAKYYGDNLFSCVFKVIHHKNLGALTFLRIYSGSIRVGEKVYNINRDSSEKIMRIYVPYADEFKNIDFACRGNIVAVSGLTSSVTSDTITSKKSVAEEARIKYAKDKGLTSDESSPVLAGIKVPEPVFFCTIEAPSSGKQKALDDALIKLQREDPSLQVIYDSQSDQTILKGMGELHLEILRDRIEREHKVCASLGKLRVSYREMPDDVREESITLQKSIGGINNRVTIKIRLYPAQNWSEKLQFKVVVTQDNELGKLRPDRKKAIKNGIEMALSYGPLASFPVFGVNVDLLEFQTTSATLDSFITAATSEMVSKGLKTMGISLLEPIMRLDISVPDIYHNRVISDLITRRGQLVDVQPLRDRKRVTALAPLSELVSYSTFLRTLTSGTASFCMHLDCYRKMTKSEQRDVLDSLFSL